MSFVRASNAMCGLDLKHFPWQVWKLRNLLALPQDPVAIHHDSWSIKKLFSLSLRRSGADSRNSFQDSPSRRASCDQLFFSHLLGICLFDFRSYCFKAFHHQLLRSRLMGLQRTMKWCFAIGTHSWRICMPACCSKRSCWIRIFGPNIIRDPDHRRWWWWFRCDPWTWGEVADWSPEGHHHHCRWIRRCYFGWYSSCSRAQSCCSWWSRWSNR